MVIKPPRIAMFNHGALGGISLPKVLGRMDFKYSPIGNSTIADLLGGGCDLLILPQVARRLLGPGL